MQNSITLHTQSIQPQDSARQQSINWLDYFDPHAALKSVRDYCGTLNSSRHERHTQRLYMSAIRFFVQWMGGTVTRRRGAFQFDFTGMAFPDKPALLAWRAEMMRDGKANRTLNGYMTAVRHFLRALEEQQIIPDSYAEFALIVEMRRQLTIAINVKYLPAQTPDDGSGSDAGTRLKVLEVNKIFESFSPGMVEDLPDITTLKGKRDLALIFLGFTSAFRAAELTRITLGSIYDENGQLLSRVRGKRGKRTPVPISPIAMQLIANYVDAYNSRLDEDDPRRITRDSPIFQPIRKGDNIPPIDDFSPGISRGAVTYIIKQRSAAVLDKSITAHDMRRTCAYIMRTSGFEFDAIQLVLRHDSVATTEKYVGRNKNYAAALITNKVKFAVPDMG